MLKLTTMNKAFAIVCVFVLFSACKPVEKIQYVDKEKIVYQNVVQHDSIFNDVHDSIFQTIYQKGDTVYNVKYKEKIKEVYKYLYKTDTLFKDSIQYVIKKDIEVKKVVPKWCYYTIALSLAFLIFAIIRIYKWLH